MGKTYRQQQRHHSAKGSSTECRFHGFPAQTFPCSRTCSQEAGRCSVAVADRGCRVAWQDSNALQEYNLDTSHGTAPFPPWYFTAEPPAILLGVRVHFAWSLALCLSLLRRLPPSVTARNQSFLAISASPEHLIRLRDTQFYYSWDQRAPNKF